MAPNQSKHLEETIRLKIAVEYLRHEMRKILPGIKDNQTWLKIDKEIARLANSKSKNSIRDFWNLVDGVCFGWKLKNLVTRLTSQNIKWSKETVVIDDLYMPSKNDFAGLKKLKIDVPSGREVKEFLFDKKNHEILKFAQKDSALNSRMTFDRDADLIIAGEQGGKLVVFDGNRRMLKNILAGKDKMPAYVGRVIKQPMYHNYWIPTSRMINLASHARIYLENNDKATAKSLSQALGHLIKSSAVAEQEFYDRVISKNNLKAESKFILKEVNKILWSGKI